MKCGECDEGYQCHACGAPLPDDHVFMAVCHTCRELATGTWAARAADPDTEPGPVVVREQEG